MVVALLLVMALQPVADASRGEPAIVVTGVRLKDLAGDLDRCLARRCSPREDIIASVRYAEGLFRTGRYRDAKALLGRAVARNKDAAEADPLAVSELYLAQANVAFHEGDQRVARAASHARARVLSAGLPADAPAVLLAELSLADLEVRNGELLRAGPHYAAIEARAQAGGHVGIAASATLRRANLAYGQGRRREAQRLLDDVMAGEGDALRAYRLAARVLAARFARQSGDAGATEGLLAMLAQEPRQAAPVLVFAPAIPAPTDGVGLDAFNRTDSYTRSSDIDGLRWIDVGFWIRADGSVDDAEQLRGNGGPALARPVLAAVGQRRYAPLADPDGQYRIERFTLTADYDTPNGSLVRRRSRNPRIERLDITGGAPAQVRAGQAGGMGGA